MSRLRRDGGRPLQPGLTLIIPTMNRPDELTTVVRGVLEQRRRPDQLIIVDQSRSDQSRNAVERMLAESSPPDVPVVDYVRNPAILGLTHARNVGIALARFDVTAFVDDDMGIEPEFLQELERPLREDPSLAGVGGVVTSYRPKPIRRLVWAIFRRGPFHDPRQAVYWNLTSLPSTAPIPSDRLAGGCVAYRTDVLRTHRFDEHYRGYSLGEDAEFSLRLSRAGLKLVINPRARAAHPLSPIGRDDWSGRMEAEVCANYYLLRRHFGGTPIGWLSFAWLLIGLAIQGGGYAIRERSPGPVLGLGHGLRIAARGLRGCRFIDLTEGAASR